MESRNGTTSTLSTPKLHAQRNRSRGLPGQSKIEKSCILAQLNLRTGLLTGPTCFLTFVYPPPWTHGQNEPPTSESSASISLALRVDSQPAPHPQQVRLPP